MDWWRLPDLVHRAVFEILAQDVLIVRLYRSSGRAVMRKHGLSRYALVCKAWQPFFEKQLYQHLTLTEASISDLRRLVVRQRRFVKHIWLKIKLRPYDCEICQGHGRQALRFRDSSGARAIIRLLQVLATWDQDQLVSPGSLTLELGAYSPSDLEHEFKNELHFTTKSWAVNELYFDAPPITRILHGWMDGRRMRPPHESSISRIFSQSYPLACDCSHRFPSVSVVGGFVLRRQTRRVFSLETIAGLLRSFPNLGSVMYETWRPFYSYPPPDQDWYDDPGNCGVILQSLPGAVRELTLFEDFNEDYNTIFSTDPIIENHNPPIQELLRARSWAAGQVLAARSLNLVRLSASYIVDANDVFAAVDPAWVWANLESLTMTSRLLVVETSLEDITRLLVRAGTAALQMPRLKRMDVWNGTKRNACAFSYEATNQHTMIKWRGTWQMPLNSDVAAVWSRVAGLYTRKDLTVADGEVLDNAAIKSHAVAIWQLGLGKRGVVHTVSLKQIDRETRRYWYT